MPFLLYDFFLALIWNVQRLQWVLGAPTALGLYFFGPLGNQPVLIALHLIVIDFITGLMKGFSWQALSSGVAYKGAMKKGAMIALIMLGHVADQTLGVGNIAKAAMAYYIAGVESVSIIENIASMGLVLPERIDHLIRAFIEDPHTPSGPEPPKGH